jgi:hypothetical protein
MILLENVSNFSNYGQHLSNFGENLPKIDILSPGIESQRKEDPGIDIDTTSKEFISSKSRYMQICYI